MILLLAQFLISVASADADLKAGENSSQNTSQWLEIRSADGKVQTFIHQSPLKTVDAEKPSFLSIYQIAKEPDTLKLMAEIKRDAKVNLGLAPANCYETDSLEPGVRQTWCENEKPMFTVVVEGGKISMKENERAKLVMASILGAPGTKR